MDTFVEVHLEWWISLEEMELTTQIQILDKAVCILLCVNALGKVMNPWQTRFFSVD